MDIGRSIMIKSQPHKAFKYFDEAKLEIVNSICQGKKVIRGYRRINL